MYTHLELGCRNLFAYKNAHCGFAWRNHYSIETFDFLQLIQ